MKNKNIYFLSLFHLIFAIDISIAQNHVLDSLHQILLTEKNDSNKVNTLNIISSKLWGISQYDSSMICAKNAEDLANKIGFKKGIANAFRNFGIVNYRRGNYSKALEYDIKSLTINQAMGNKNGIAANLGNIGLIYTEQGNYIQALTYHFKSLELFKELGNKMGIANNFGNIGSVYKSEGDFPNALEYYNRSLSLHREIGNKIGIANNTGNIGLTYESQGNHSKAMEYAFKAMVINREIGNKTGISSNSCNIGTIYIRQKKYDLARVYLDSALTLSKKIGEKGVIKDAYAALALLDSATGNYRSGWENFKNNIIYRDSLNNEANAKKIVQAEMNFELEKKEAEATAEQDKQTALADADSRKQKIIIWSVASVLILVIVLAGSIFRSLLRARMQKIIIEEKQREILDSIHYAKKIQRSLLPTDKYIDKVLKRMKR